MRPRIYLDTNIFVKAFEGEGGDVAARGLLELLESATGLMPDFCTSEITLAELLVKPFRELDELRLACYESLLRSSSWLEVGPVTREVSTGAALLRAQASVKLPDAIHSSTALHLHCERFLTADEGIRGEYSLRYNLGGRSWGSEITTVIRPDVGTLADLR